MSGGLYSGNNRRGLVRVPQHAHPLVRQFVEAMNEQHTTFAELSDRSGVGIDTMRFWLTRHTPVLGTFEAALNVLDLELCIRKRRPTATPKESVQ